MIIFYCVSSLILGFLAWGLSIDAAWHTATKRLGLSWVCCAIALLFQVLTLELMILVEDWSALLDTIHAISLCSRVLLLGTGIFSLLTAIRSRQK